MARVDKPRHRAGYSSEETLQVKAACLTIAVTLGAHLDDLCIVGGLVPTLLIDGHLGAKGDDRAGLAEADLAHPGTNDLDVGLAVALLDGHRYVEIGRRLRQEDFRPDENASGNAVRQRWRLRDLHATIDFLMAPVPGGEPGGRIQPLEPDFGALVTPGLELAFDERIEVELAGHTLHGEQVTRAIPVCGPAAFTILKALAFADRGEPKDAYDLVYVLRGVAGMPPSVADRLATHATAHPALIEQALTFLRRDFADPKSLGPRRAAAFEFLDAEAHDAAAADAHGYIDDLLVACRARRLIS